MKVKNVLNKLLAGVLAAGMIASAVPAMADEAETITSEIKASYFADWVMNNEGGGQNGAAKNAYVNEVKYTNPSAYNVRSYAEFDIPNIEAATKVVLKVYAALRSDRDSNTTRVLTSKFAAHYPNSSEENVYNEESECYTYYKTYNPTGNDLKITIKDKTAEAETDPTDVKTFEEKLDEQLTYTLSGGIYSYSGDIKLNYSDKLEALKENGGKLAFNTRGGNNVGFGLNKATLLVTYDKTKLEAAANTELAAANTAEKVEAFVKNWNNSLFTVDTKSISDMSVVYNALAEQSFTSVDDFVTAYNNTVNAFKKTVKYTKPTNYAIYSTGQKFGAGKVATQEVLVNKNVYTYKVGDAEKEGSVNLSGLYTYEQKPIYGYKLTNAAAITDIKFVTSLSNGNNSEQKVQCRYKIDKEFLLPTKPMEYTETTEEYSKVKEFNALSVFKNIQTQASSSYAEYVVDLNELKEDLVKIDSENGSVDLMLGLNYGGGGIGNNMNASYLQVTYDTSLINANFKNDVNAAATKEAMGKVFDKYNEFIGADTSALINIDYVYADLDAKVASGTEYTYEALKADFDKFVKNYLVEVTYNTPSDYVLYKVDRGADAFNGKYAEQRALLNTDIAYVDGSNDPYYGKKWRMNGFNTYHVRPIMGYDLKDTQAITNIKFNFPINNDTDECALNYTVENQFPIQGAAGEYKSETDTFKNTVEYWGTIKRIVSFKHATDNIDITDSVLNELQSSSSNTLVMSVFSGGHGRFDWNNVKLTVTYDTTALTSNTSNNDYNVSARMGEYYKVTVNPDVEYGETTEVSSKTVEASITANKTTTEGFTVVGAAYKDGVLVNVKTAACSAMNVMGREKVRLEGLADCEYDAIRVFTLSGEGGIQPAADDVTLSE